ncbi:hypothetical protein [Massilia sp. NP310]|uniref:hypothetical protein n=1 Tax=Massilia sp. NP310 TaxID=2861282 RepID=UPI001C62D5A6|nr:hypothetical protein [Massilia sp. NP310]QYG02515.1 hypothetical protein KY496_03525 [Massilia sp. NP310]
MLQIRKITLRGDGVKDASVVFEAGANVLAGESDTGKSYLLQCLDFIFGAEKIKRLKEATPNYKMLFVEFENSRGEFLTLVRPIDGGKLRAYHSSIKEISGSGDIIDPKRSGKSIRPDITSVVLPFAGINDAQLRKNALGKTQRLTVRTLAPLFFVGEVTVIDEFSPVLGRPGFDTTALKRTLSYVLTGTDDRDIIASEANEVIKSRLKAKLELIVDLLAPLEARYQNADTELLDEEDEADAFIDDLAEAINDVGRTRSSILQSQQDLTKSSIKADSQLLGIGELRTRYTLLDERYSSDLQRLDFIAEGAHFISALQDVNCPLCDQNMPDHEHITSNNSHIRASAVAEAAKIKAHRRDLAEAIADLDQKRETVINEKSDAISKIANLQHSLDTDIELQMSDLLRAYENQLKSRADREANRSDREHWISLHKVKNELEIEISASVENRQDWGGISSVAQHGLCVEIEGVLRDWAWGNNPRVEFDEKEYDIIVDGQPRNSHGKGVRAILYSAFTIGLLRYCAKNGKPHFGVVVIDSPLTSYKKKGAKSVRGADGEIPVGVEAAFWESLKNIPKGIQVIVIENKEPPADVASAVHYEWFAGDDANEGDRAGFIPQ